MNATTRVLGTAAAGFLGLALLAAVLMGAQAIWDGLPNADRAFTSTDWAATPQDERYVFTDDLIRRKVLIGLTEAEVSSLLGPAESRRKIPDGAGAEELVWEISEGYLDPDVLSVDLDPAGRVRRVRVHGT